VLPGPLGQATVALGRVDVFDPGHDGPTLAERVDDRRDPVAGDERPNTET
jgi:hypothetical protein